MPVHHDSPTTNAIEEAIKVDKPVVAATTAQALTWIGVAYAIAAILIELGVNVLTMVDLPEELARFGLAPALLGILRVLERMVRFQLQQRGGDA